MELGQRVALGENLLENKEGVLLDEEDDPQKSGGYQQQEETSSSSLSRIHSRFTNLSFGSQKKRKPKPIKGFAGQTISVADQASCERAYWAVRNSQAYFALQNSFQYPTAQAYVERLCQEARAANRTIVETTGGGGGVAVLTHVTKNGSSYHAAQELALLGFHLILLGKKSTKLQQIETCIQREAVRRKIPKSTLTIYKIHDYDPDSLETVLEAAEQTHQILERHYQNKLHILIHNPAGVAVEYGTTQDGIEVNLGRNFVAAHVLTEELLPCLRQAATAAYKPRIVNVSSVGHCNGTDFNFERFLLKPQEGGAPEWTFQKDEGSNVTSKPLRELVGPTLSAAKDRMVSMTKNSFPFVKPPNSDADKSNNEDSNNEESTTTETKSKLQIPSSLNFTNPFQKESTKATFTTMASLAGRLSLLNHNKRDSQQGYVPPSVVEPEPKTSSGGAAVSKEEEETQQEDDKKEEGVAESTVVGTSDMDPAAADSEYQQVEISQADDGKQQVKEDAHIDQEIEPELEDKPANIDIDQDAFGQEEGNAEPELLDKEQDQLDAEQEGHAEEDEEHDKDAFEDERRKEEQEEEEEEEALEGQSPDASKDEHSEQQNAPEEPVLEVEEAKKSANDEDKEIAVIDATADTDARIKEDAQEQQGATEAAVPEVNGPETDLAKETEKDQVVSFVASDAESADDEEEDSVVEVAEEEENTATCIDAEAQRSKIASMVDTTAFAQVKMYYRSKMASIADGIALAREEQSLAVISVYPGSVEAQKKKKALGIADSMYQTTFKAFNLNPSQAARSTLRAALDPDINTQPSLQGGVYLHCDGNPWIVDNPTVVNPATSEPYSLDEYSTHVRNCTKKLCNKLMD